MIISAVAAVVALIIALVTAIVVRFRYRRSPRKQSSETVDYIQNSAYEGDKEGSIRRLPNVPYSEDGYEEPATYAQLDSSKRIPVDKNYQGLIIRGKQGVEKDVPDSAGLQREDESQKERCSLENNKDVEKESVYEELS